MWIPKICKFDNLYGQKTIIEKTNNEIYEGILKNIYKSKTNDWGIILYLKKINEKSTIYSCTITVSDILIKNVKVFYSNRKNVIQQTFNILNNDIQSLILELDNDYIEI